MHVHSAAQRTYLDTLFQFSMLDSECWNGVGGYTATLVLSGRRKESQIREEKSLRGKRVRIMIEGWGPRRTEYMDMEIKLD